MHLQVILGRERGQIYPVTKGTYVVGRGTDTTIVLASDLVSRHHATIVVGETEVRVTDLESSNGTFINGARVRGDAVAVEGDILLIGDYPMRVHGRKVPVLTKVPIAADMPSNVSGSLLEVPPSTLLRYIAVLKKTCVLQLTSPPLRSSISFTRGHVAEVVVDTRKTRDPMQALTAILRWKGTFEVTPSDRSTSSLLLGLDALLPPIGTDARPSMVPPRA